MIPSEVLFSRLSGYAGLSALIGSRIYPDQLPQRPVLPASTYKIRDEEWLHTGGIDSTLIAVVLQIRSFGRTYSEAEGVGLQVLAALQRWRGTEIGVTVQGTFFENQSDPYMSTTGIYVQDQEWRLWLEELSPVARIVFPQIVAGRLQFWDAPTPYGLSVSANRMIVTDTQSDGSAVVQAGRMTRVRT